MLKTKIQFVILASALMLLWGFVYFDNILTMEAIWRRSDTFAHGYFIAPIVLWLFWRDKTYLLNSQPRTSLLAIPFILGSLVLYLFAYAADINVLSQLSAVLALISIVWFLLGNKLAWHYKFPLAYLFFLVPMGENLIPQLQDITAWFTVAFLKLHGIPVFRDGLYIQTPTGLFEVAVACSGIRYLIASVAVGTLFAYLSYQTLKKQLIFIAFAFLLPILANGIRAYLIVIIAHYSDMKYATGADHLVYGWVFFGLVIMLMFWVGGRFADPELSDEESATLAKQASTESYFSRVSFTLVASVFVGALYIQHTIPVRTAPIVPQIKTLGLNPIQHSDWGISHNNSLELSHVTNSNSVEVFMAKYANLQHRGELISFGNKLHDEDAWTVIERQAFSINGQDIVFVGLRNINGKTRSYLYRYRIGQYSTGSRVFAKFYQALNSVFRRSDYSYIEAVSVINGESYLNDKAELVEYFTKIFIDESFDENR